MKAQADGMDGQLSGLKEQLDQIRNTGLGSLQTDMQSELSKIKDQMKDLQGGTLKAEMDQIRGAVSQMSSNFNAETMKKFKDIEKRIPKNVIHEESKTRAKPTGASKRNIPVVDELVDPDSDGEQQQATEARRTPAIDEPASDPSDEDEMAADQPQNKEKHE